MIDPVTTLEEAAGLVEVKWNAVFDALHFGDDDPAIIAEPGSFPGFTAAGDTFDLIMVLFVRDTFRCGFPAASVRE